MKPLIQAFAFLLSLAVSAAPCALATPEICRDRQPGPVDTELSIEWSALVTGVDSDSDENVFIKYNKVARYAERLFLDSFKETASFQEWMRGYASRLNLEYLIEDTEKRAYIAKALSDLKVRPFVVPEIHLAMGYAVVCGPLGEVLNATTNLEEEEIDNGRVEFQVCPRVLHGLANGSAAAEHVILHELGHAIDALAGDGFEILDHKDWEKIDQYSNASQGNMVDQALLLELRAEKLAVILTPRKETREAAVAGMCSTEFLEGVSSQSLLRANFLDWWNNWFSR